MIQKSPLAHFIWCSAMIATVVVCHAQKQVDVFHPTGFPSINGMLDSDWEKDGRWTEFYPDGTKRAEKVFVHGRQVSMVTYDSIGHKRLETDFLENGTVLYMAYHTNGFKASHSNIHPDLLLDTLTAIDRPYFIDRFDDNGQFVSQYIHLTFIEKSDLPFHRFYSRTRMAETRAVENDLRWYPFAGISSADGYFDEENGDVTIQWPDRGVSDDPRAREFDGSGKDDNRLQSYFVNGLPYGNWLNYYPNGRLWYSVNFKEGVLDGELKSYYFSGQVAMECHFDGGRPEGEIYQWNADGSEKSVSRYADGHPEGEWKRWEKGQLVEQRIYVHGELMKGSTLENGVVRSFDRHDALDLNTPSAQEVDKDGRLIARSYYGLHERYGTQGKLYDRVPLLGLTTEVELDGSIRISYSENESQVGFAVVTDQFGSVLSAEYVFSPSDRMTINYSTTGEPTFRSEVDDRYETKAVEALFKKLRKEVYLPNFGSAADPLSGKVGTSYPNGKKWSESTYAQGLQNGRTTVWDVNGQKLAEGDFIAGRPVGIHRRWTVEGKLVDERRYENGRPQEEHKRWEPNTSSVHLNESYVDGELNGWRTIFSIDGLRISEEEFRKGKLQGLSVVLDEQGQQVGFHTYAEGRLSGPADEMVTPDVRGKGAYREGHRHGPWELLTLNGTHSAFFFEGRELTGSDPQRCELDVDLPLVSQLESERPFSELLSLAQFQMWTADHLVIDERQYRSLIDVTRSDAPIGTAVVAIPDQLILECTELPGFRFDLAPLSGIAEYSEMPLKWERKDYFLRQYPRFADSSFTGSALDYFHLGADHFILDERSLIDMTRHVLMENYSLDEDSAAAVIQKQIIRQGILTEPLTSAQWPATADPEKTMADLQEALYVLCIDADPTTRTRTALEKVDEYYRSIAGEHFRMQMDQRMSQFTIDLLPEVVQLKMPPHQISSRMGQTKEGATLSMRPSMLRYNTESGMSNVSATDYCFAEGYIGGSRFTLDFDVPRIILRPRKLRELISDTQDYYFFAENLGLEFTGVFAAEAWGRFETSSGQTVFLEFTNLGITDKYLAGRLKIDLPEEHSHEVFKEMEKAFTYHEIISEWDGLEIYFMRLKPKTP